MGMPRKWVSVTRAFRALAVVAAGVLGLPTVALAGHFSLRPISASGSHTIVGTDEIRLFGGDQTVRVEIFLSDWAPSSLGLWQARIDSTTYSNGIGADLTLAQIACPNSAFCAQIYEFGSVCSNMHCTFAFINSQRSDWVFYETEGCGGLGVLKGVNLINPSTLYYALTDCPLEKTTGEFPSYGGGLVLYVPPDARGVYEIDFDRHPQQSLMAEPSNQIIDCTFSNMRIVILCGTAADCDDGNLCTTDVCGQDGHCLNLPALEGTHCGSSNATECDAQDTCNGLGACVDRVKPADTPCRDAVDECDLAATCDGAASDCPESQAAPDGLVCSDDGDPCTSYERCIGGICWGFDDCSCAAVEVCGDGCCMTPGESTTTCPADCSDLRNISEFMNCFMESEPLIPPCEPLDLDGDGTISPIDFSLYLRRTFGGP